MDMLQSALEAYPWGIYLCLALAPFIQEDAAVILGASTAAQGIGSPALLFVTLLIGLSASDLWKYWAGRWGRKYKKADWIASHGKVALVRDKVVEKLAMTLMVTRFVPGTRIPIYLASGFFKAPFDKFAIWVMASGALYIAITFALFYALGEVAGERAKIWAPVIAISLVVLILLVQWIKAKKAPAV
ncbi:hypothetical protein MNBD_ALPHA06-847 [hydrothermal vent metagenome]|uniref:VTT domain-containing protein n=1 Tax=hydrothermal vent metagenome TaxID=652676 RepID=A0A3B0RLG8_9ZZZZ